MMLLNFNDSLKNEDQLIRTKTETRKIKRNEKKMEKKMKMREKKEPVTQRSNMVNGSRCPAPVLIKIGVRAGQ